MRRGTVAQIVAQESFSNYQNQILSKPRLLSHLVWFVKVIIPFSLLLQSAETSLLVESLLDEEGPTRKLLGNYASPNTDTTRTPQQRWKYLRWKKCGEQACLLARSGERGRNRTFNLLIKSQLLCQLSYAPFDNLRLSASLVLHYRAVPIAQWQCGCFPSFHGDGHIGGRTMWQRSKHRSRFAA